MRRGVPSSSTPVASNTGLALARPNGAICSRPATTRESMPASRSSLSIREPRHQVGGFEARQAVRVDPIPEFRDAVGGHRQAGGLLVPAVLLEQVGTAVEGAEHVERRNRPARTVRDAVLDRQDDRRLVERVDELGRDDADHAAMPALARHDEDVVSADADVGLDLLLRVGDDVGFVGLAAGVLFAELLGEPPHFVELGLVACEQQARGEVGRAHATCGIDPRRNHERDVEPVDGRVLQAGRFEQRPQADRVRPLRQPLQTELGDDAVFADQRHDVGDGADRGQLQERRQPFLAVRTAGTSAWTTLNATPTPARFLSG